MGLRNYRRTNCKKNISFIDTTIFTILGKCSPIKHIFIFIFF